MFYKIKFEKKAASFIKKLDDYEKKIVINTIDKLAEKPFPSNKRHILDLAGSSMLCELAVGKIRIYYTIENQFVVIEEIEYKGVVTVLEGSKSHKSGNKNYPRQQKDIKRIKKTFKTKK